MLDISARIAPTSGSFGSLDCAHQLQRLIQVIESLLRIAAQLFKATEVDKQLCMCLRMLVLGLSRDLQRFAEVAVGFLHAILIAQRDRDFRDDRAETRIVLMQELSLDTQ